MPSLNLDLDFFDHPKVKRLIGLLGKGSEVLPIRLWAYCGKYHCDSGRLTEISAQEIESIMCWWGTSGVAVEALVKVGFLEVVPEGGYQVHDWLEHEGHLVAYKKKARAAALKRWEKVNSNVCLEHSPSIASSNAKEVSKHCLDPVMHRDGEKSSNEELLKERAVLLCEEWIFRFKGTQGSERDRLRVGQFFAAWLAAGGDFEKILAAIKAPRDVTEPTWELKKRITAHETNGKPKRLTAAESVARRREKEGGS